MRLLIYGTGMVAKEFLDNIPDIKEKCKIVGFCQTKKTMGEFRGIRLYSIDETLPHYDYMIVANTYADEIYSTCIDQKIDLKKVIFLYPLRRMVGCNNLKIIKEVLGEKNWTNYCARLEIYDKSFFGDDCKQYERLNTRENFKVKRDYLWPIITDKYDSAGKMHNYFWQDLWAAKLIHKNGTKEHFDIGSRIDGFIAHLLAMDINVTLIDIREFPNEVKNLHTIVDDATTLRQIEDESISSMSALCSLEHFGLGRYGDPIDPEACFKCFRNIQKKISMGGHLYLSVPIGRERVEFNAHRVFYADTIVKEFGAMKLLEFSCAAESTIEYNVDIHKYDTDQHNGEYRYGLFHFIKD